MLSDPNVEEKLSKLYRKRLQILNYKAAQCKVFKKRKTNYLDLPLLKQAT